MTLGLASKMRLRTGNFRFKNVFWPQISSEVGTSQGILGAGPEVVHKTRSPRLFFAI